MVTLSEIILTKHSPYSAMNCMQQYILYRLIPHGNDERIERSIVTYIWIVVSTDRYGKDSALPTAIAHLNAFYGSWKKVLRTTTSQCVHTVSLIDQDRFA